MTKWDIFGTQCRTLLPAITVNRTILDILTIVADLEYCSRSNCKNKPAGSARESYDVESITHETIIANGQSKLVALIRKRFRVEICR